MKRKLDTRFPAARIKKIMQADENVGKIAMAVPLLVSKALEFFLQDLCDRTYEVTLMRGAKTMNSLHLVYRPLMPLIFSEKCKVPDLVALDAAGEDHSVSKRRKVIGDDYNGSDDESKRSRMDETGHVTSCGRGEGRGRVRGRGRGRTAERERASHCEKLEDDPDVSHCQEKHTSGFGRLADGVEPDELKKHNPVGKNNGAPFRNFDLNVDLDDNGDCILSVAPTSPTTENIHEKEDECRSWSLCEIEKMAIDPIELANSNRGIDEEDYDEEG